MVMLSFGIGLKQLVLTGLGKGRSYGYKINKTIMVKGVSVPIEVEVHLYKQKGRRSRR